MEEEQKSVNAAGTDTYDSSDRPFDFVEENAETALICESDPVLKEKISAALKTLGYQITEVATARDALKSMRFHVYDLVILNENFDSTDQAGAVLNNLANLNMSTRRQIFVALISNQFRTSDNMAAFNKSVNLIINTANIDDIDAIIKRGVADNNAFYHVFKDTLKKKGII
jgi:CheY-like chemotaxis protein